MPRNMKMNEAYHFRQIEEAVKRLEKKNQNLEKQMQNIQKATNDILEAVKILKEYAETIFPELKCGDDD